MKTVRITSSVPVEHDPQRLPGDAGCRPGIYDREGVTVGQSYTRTYTFTRHDGPGGAITYNVGWIGNDGTFSSPGDGHVGRGRLGHPGGDGQPGNRRVPLGDPDADDPTSRDRVPDDEHGHRAARVQRGNNYSVTTHRHDPPRTDGSLLLPRSCRRTGAQGRHDRRRHAPGAGAIRFLRWHPWGLAIDSNAASNCYNPNPAVVRPATRRAGRRRTRRPVSGKSASMLTAGRTRIPRRRRTR